MLTRSKTTLAAAALALSALAGGPALAGGSVGLTVSPGTPEGDLALRTGLAIFGLANGMNGGGHIGQHGNGNAGGLLQNGSGNLGIVHQEGNGHNGTIQQNGHGNAHGLFQFGENTDAHVQQTGNGQSGVTVQYGF
ncbi:curlin [Salinarimonas sp.]|uniref:curlin n=1 Tax=Salinarimonas sp. TaxID=2766526 RepID=UPI0032D8C458